MDALPPLARVLRYGNVRETDAERGRGHRRRARGPHRRRAAAAAGALDDDARGRAGRAHRRRRRGASACSSATSCATPWRGALARLVDRADVHGRVAGRCTRILHDAGLLEPAELERRMSLTLSPGNDPAAGAAWIEGFLGRSGLVLIHDETLLRLDRRWLAAVARRHLHAAPAGAAAHVLDLPGRRAPTDRRAGEAPRREPAPAQRRRRSTRNSTASAPRSCCPSCG